MIAAESHKRLHLEQRHLPAFLWLVRIKAGFLTEQVPVAFDAATCDQLEFEKRMHGKKRARCLVQKADGTLP
jgi:hypothetical protein